MFGQVNPVFLKPFSSDETSALLTGLGSAMFLDWSPEATEMVHGESGGAPFFIRDLASRVFQLLTESGPEDASVRAAVSDVEVSAALGGWRPIASNAWGEIVKALHIHYPDAAYLLSPDVVENDLSEWISGDINIESAAEVLRDLGYLDCANGKWSCSHSLLALQRLGLERLQALRPDDEASIIDLISRGESSVLEFKSTAKFDLRSKKAEVHISDAVVKTVAGFANAGGGDLLIGVDDEGQVLGLENDLKLFKDREDGFERWLIGDLLGKALGQATVTSLCSVGFLKVRGRLIIRVGILRAPDVVFVNDQTVYLRTGNQTRELSGREVVDFARTRKA
jgi:hypothetical protein